QRVEAEAKGAQMQIDAVNSGMLRLYQKNQGDISAVNGEIGQLQSALQNQNGTISTLQLDVLNNRLETQNLVSDIDKAATRITILETVSAESKQQIQELEATIVANNAEAQAAIDSLNLSVIELDNLLEIAKDTIAKQDLIISKLDERIENLETTIQNLADAYGRTDAELALLQFEFDKLQQDLDEDKELADARSDLIEAKLVILQHKANRSGGGTSLSVKQNLKDEQNSLLELTSKLSGKPGEFEPINDIDLNNATNTPESKFKQQFNELLDSLTSDAMTPEQIEDLRSNVKTDFKDELGLAIGTLLIPNLVDLQRRTSPEAISQGVQTGICQSLNNGSCPATPGNPNPVQGLGGVNNNLNNFAAAADLAQGAAILGYVKNTNEAVRHAKYGLEVVQGFADTAWKATHADKILNGITTALVLHNAAMLSSNLAQTVGEAASGVLSAIGIKDSEGEAFDVNAVIKAKMTELISSVIGSANYEALTKKIAAANRIYQSAANVLDLTRSLFDSARNVAELTAENTGKIGNALRESGAVYEDAYQLMQEKVNPQNQAMRRLEGLTNTLQTLEQGASAISEVSSEVVETRENIEQLKAERKQLEDETKLFLDAEKVKKEDIKTESQAQTEIAKLDFAKDETDS
ncbi:MAG: hypothetical protein ACRDBG_13110, partial [Waterburya sp.]